MNPFTAKYAAPAKAIRLLSNQQQKISTGHVGDVRPEQDERENFVKYDVGEQYKQKRPQRYCGSALKPIAVVRSFGGHRNAEPLDMKESVPQITDRYLIDNSYSPKRRKAINLGDKSVFWA